MNENEFKLTQFADDTSVILDGSDTSLRETLNELSFYAKISGLKSILTNTGGLDWGKEIQHKLN